MHVCFAGRPMSAKWRAFAKAAPSMGLSRAQQPTLLFDKATLVLYGEDPRACTPPSDLFIIHKESKPD